MKAEDQEETVELLREAYRWARQAGRSIEQLKARPQDDVNTGVLGFAAEHLEKALQAIRAAGVKVGAPDL